MGESVQPAAVQTQPSVRAWLAYVPGILLLIGLVVATKFLSGRAVKALEYPIWAVTLGLLANLVLSATKTKQAVTPVIRTELFLKTGLVLLGTSVNLTEIGAVGLKGFGQAVIMVTSVFLFTWWVAGLFKLTDTLKAVIATSLSVCGVSAAIVAAGSVLARKEELTYVTALVILTSFPLMILAPYMASWMDLSPAVAGAWFGGNIDTTAAVVGAGTLYGEQAVKVASIVKLSQNALIGIVAFLLAFYWAAVVQRDAGQRPSARLLWERFPKFVLGFVLASALASFGLFSKAQLASIKAAQTWIFALAFVCIALELSFKEFGKMGVRPVAVYGIATVFNTVLALGVSYLIFG